MIALVTGSALIGGDMLLSGCRNAPQLGGKAFSEDDIRFLDEVAETILPRTATPGAKDAATGQFMAVMVNDTYDQKDQEVFHNGIRQLNEACREKYGSDFLSVTPEQRYHLLLQLDKEAKEYQQKKREFDKEQSERQKEELKKGNAAYEKEKMSAHYYTMMKQLALLGFFTSKPGATEALRHIAVPGKYEGCIDYKKGDKAWA